MSSTRLSWLRRVPPAPPDLAAACHDRPVPDELTERWIAGWAAMRGLEISTNDGWPLIHVRSASRRSELICVAPGVEEFRTLLPHVAGDPAAMLTVVGTDLIDYRSLPLPEDVRVDRHDETLMTVAIEPGDIHVLPDGLVATWDHDARITRYHVREGDRIVAEGAVGLHDSWATFDAVETAPTHQRQGLGRHVVSALSAHAHGRGARHAVLAASADGRGLYASLGWTVERELLSLMGTSPPQGGVRNATSQSRRRSGASGDARLP